MGSVTLKTVAVKCATSIAKQTKNHKKTRMLQRCKMYKLCSKYFRARPCATDYGTVVVALCDGGAANTITCPFDTQKADHDMILTRRN